MRAVCNGVYDAMIFCSMNLPELPQAGSALYGVGGSDDLYGAVLGRVLWRADLDPGQAQERVYGRVPFAADALSSRVAAKFLDHPAVVRECVPGVVELGGRFKAQVDKEDVLPRHAGHRT
jgi:hypothetical protein